MSCGTCVIKINRSLEGLNGYSGLMAHIEKNLVAVDHIPALKPAQIAMKITAAGYPATLAEKSEFDPNEDLAQRSSGWRNPDDGILSKLFGFLLP